MDQALCFGWIDGVRRRIDELSYSIRFTPRRRGSNWSAVNVGRAKELIERGLMRPAGLEAFQARKAGKSRVYSYEQRQAAQFSDEQLRRFRANQTAWDFFRSQAPWYRRTATWWVISAKREETRGRRLARLIEDSEQGRTIRELTRPTKP